MDKLRSIEVRVPLPNISFGSKGYFHKWCDEPFFDTALNHYLSKTFALIEFTDGSVKFLDPETIKFIKEEDSKGVNPSNK